MTATNFDLTLNSEFAHSMPADLQIASNDNVCDIVVYVGYVLMYRYHMLCDWTFRVFQGEPGKMN